MTYKKDWHIASQLLTKRVYISNGSYVDWPMRTAGYTFLDYPERVPKRWRNLAGLALVQSKNERNQ